MTGRRLPRAVPAPALFMISGISQHLGSAVAVGLFVVMPATTVAWWRMLVSALILLAWRRPWRTRWTRRTLAGSAIFGVVLGAMNLLFYSAIDHLPLGTAVSLEYLGPVAVAALGRRGFRARAAIALALLGVVSIGGLGLDWSEPGTAAGVAFALAAGAAWAVYIVLGRRIAGARSGLDSLAVGMATASLVYAPVAVPTAGAAFSTALLLAAVVGVAVLSSLLPYAIEQVALTRLPAATFALLTSLLPATSLLVGLVVLLQVPTVGEVVGLVLISLAVLLASRDDVPPRASRAAGPAPVPPAGPTAPPAGPATPHE
ncbi:EamA family transporter [Georgenia subflava]|uniref:EamA family transporter n=1 Tax=Georgenia subflava TaxID=1622177 RepID=A0A6N7EEL9_9MICO|nr:EamA family transporter [Georgenia subflava]MPV36872.1 EamA family transporter [Georgenia subflava]